MAVTIKDVARETGLAISTISKYWNGGTVREKNRVLIEEAVKKLGYSPSNAARGLRTSKSYMVGLITGPIRTPHQAMLVSEIERKMRTMNYSLIFASPEGNDAQAEEYVEYMVENGVDGIIAVPTSGRRDFLNKARIHQVPVVVLEEGSRNVKSDCVQVDCAFGAYQLVEHLIIEGHKRIAVICGPERMLNARERLTGYLRAMEDYEYEVQPEYVIPGEYTYTSGYEGMLKLWELKVRPTAVFASNYDICLGAIDAIHRLGISVPEELSVVSFDDFELSVLVRPKLTTVRQPISAMSDVACQLLYKRMQSDYSDFPGKIRLKPEFICRESVKPPRREETGEYA